jgi:hypothetical protein
MKNAWDVSFLPAKGGILPRLSMLLHPHIEGEAAAIPAVGEGIGYPHPTSKNAHTHQLPNYPYPKQLGNVHWMWANPLGNWPWWLFSPWVSSIGAGSWLRFARLAGVAAGSMRACCQSSSWSRCVTSRRGGQAVLERERRLGNVRGEEQISLMNGYWVYSRETTNYPPHTCIITGNFFIIHALPKQCGYGFARGRWVRNGRFSCGPESLADAKDLASVFMATLIARRSRHMPSKTWPCAYNRWTPKNYLFDQGKWLVWIKQKNTGYANLLVHA